MTAKMAVANSVTYVLIVKLVVRRVFGDEGARRAALCGLRRRIRRKGKVLAVSSTVRARKIVMALIS